MKATQCSGDYDRDAGENDCLVKTPNTVKSRYNGFQGTGENNPLLPKSVIAKMTMVD